MVVVVRLPNTAHESNDRCSGNGHCLHIVVEDAYIHLCMKRRVKFQESSCLLEIISFRPHKHGPQHSTRTHTHLQQNVKDDSASLMMPKPRATIYAYNHYILFIFCVRFLHFVLFSHLLNSFWRPYSFRRTRKYENERTIYLRFTFVPNSTDISNEGLNFLCVNPVQTVHHVMSHSRFAIQTV